MYEPESLVESCLNFTDLLFSEVNGDTWFVPFSKTYFHQGVILVYTCNDLMLTQGACFCCLSHLQALATSNAPNKDQSVKQEIFSKV